MSQAGIINIAGGGGGGTPVQTLTGNSGGAVPPTANNINILGDDSIINNTNGITVIGNPGTSTETVTLTNRITGTVTTTNATPTTLLTFPFNTNTGPGTYLFDFHTVAYNATALLGAGYETQFAVRYDGANGNLITPADFVIIEEGAMIGASLGFISTGSPVLTVQVTGLAGNTIDWLTSGTYIYVS